MTFSIPKQTKRLWQCRTAVAVLLLCTVFAAAGSHYKWCFIPFAVFLLFGVVVAFWYVPTFFNSFLITVGHENIVTNYGVFFKVTQIMPYPRLVYAGSFSTPVSSAFGLCGVVLKAARSFILIPEVAKSEADMLLRTISGES